MSSARVGSRSHGRNIGRFEDEDSRRPGAAAGGGDVENNRNLRVCDPFDDAASGFDKASWSIDLDQYSLIVAALGFVEGAGDVFLGNRLNGVVDDDLEDFRGGIGTQNQQCDEPDQDPRNGTAFHPSGHLQYFYSYLRLATDIYSALVFPEAADGGPLQPGRSVLPVMRRAPRS